MPAQSIRGCPEKLGRKFAHPYVIPGRRDPPIGVLSRARAWIHAISSPAFVSPCATGYGKGYVIPRALESCPSRADRRPKRTHYPQTSPIYPALFLFMPSSADTSEHAHRCKAHVTLRHVNKGLTDWHGACSTSLANSRRQGRGRPDSPHQAASAWAVFLLTRCQETHTETDMRLSVKYLRTNEYTHDHEEVPPGTLYGFWRVIEHTGAGWFPWPERYISKQKAEAQMEIAHASA